jgi:hypothetical protein
MAGEMDYQMETVRNLSGEVEIIVPQPVYAGPYSVVYHGKLKSDNQLVRPHYHRTLRLAQWPLTRLLSKP